MNKIKILSKILSLLLMTIAISIPFFMFGAEWLAYSGSEYSILGISMKASSDIVVHSLKQFFVYYLINLIPGSILVICFGALACLFKLYANGLYFTDRNIFFYKSVGYSLIIHFFAVILSIVLNSILFTEPNYQLNFSSLSFADILTGMVILCISWVFNEANKIEQENKLTI